MKNQEEIKRNMKKVRYKLYLTFEYLRESTGKLSNDSACLAF